MRWMALIRPLLPSRPQHWHTFPHSHRYPMVPPAQQRACKSKQNDSETNKEKTSKLSQLYDTNFARICNDVHVQVLRDRSVAKPAKLPSRWRATLIQYGAEFCIRSTIKKKKRKKQRRVWRRATLNRGPLAQQLVLRYVGSLSLWPRALRSGNALRLLFSMEPRTQL